VDECKSEWKIDAKKKAIPINKMEILTHNRQPTQPMVHIEQTVRPLQKNKETL